MFKNSVFGGVPAIEHTSKLLTYPIYPTGIKQSLGYISPPQPVETGSAELSRDVKNEMTLCFESPEKAFIQLKYQKKKVLSTESKEEEQMRTGEHEKGFRRAKQTKNAFRKARGLLRQEVSVTPVFINNAIHICGTSRPHTFFSNLRHVGSSPWVSTHFLWQQGRRA